MKAAPTLADAAIRESFRGHTVPKEIGPRIAAARRFVLDKEASRFLSDLAHASFVGGGKETIEHLNMARQLARLPHQNTWIEYDARAFRTRTMETFPDMRYTESNNFGAGPSAPIDEVVPRLGWLMETHPQLETAFQLTLVADGGSSLIFTMPYYYGWTTDDTIPPWPSSMNTSNPEAYSDSGAATGVWAFNVPQVVCSWAPWARQYSSETCMKLIKENLGELRFAWALLAAINDVPISLRHVEESKNSYFAKGKYRNFLSHSIISINIPKDRDPIKMARRVIELCRKRAHQVRGHWRRDWRHEGNRIWVKEHQRGDAALGFVTHDYNIHHDE
jgi:hypothetical protein